MENKDGVTKFDVVTIFEGMAALLFDFFAVEPSAGCGPHIDKVKVAIFFFNTAMFTGAFDIHDDDVSADATP